MVTSVPSFKTFAFPIGTVKLSETGISNDCPYKSSFSRKTIGLGSLIAVFSRPFASAP